MDRDQFEQVVVEEVGQRLDVAEVYVQQERYAEAVAVQPDDLPLLRQAALFCLQSNRPKPAREYLDRIVRLAEKDARKHRADRFSTNQ